MTSCCAKKSSPAIYQRLEPYKPLIIMVMVVLLGSITLSWALNASWMPLFMGLFMLNFAMFKLFDIKGFANSFALYDMIARRSKTYSHAYPFIELTLGIGYLTHMMPMLVNALTAFIMAVGLIGIIRVRRSGAETRCACMGALINVPVGAITILENSLMVVMAIFCLATG